jgi:ADP-ribose pyrophosphatase
MIEPQSTRIVFHGRVFDVTSERVRLPNGVERDLEVVRHRGSVVLIPMPDPDSVVLVRQYRHPLGAWLWELPAGTLEPGEDPESAARRECEEETGLAPGRVARLGSFYPAPGYCDERMVFYLLTSLTRPDRPAAPDADEVIETQTFAVEAVREMVRRGEIADMKTALGLTLIG